MSTISGTGTRFYGHTQFHKTDSSYFVTKWISFFYLPIFPLSRYKISFSEAEPGFSGTQQKYYVHEKSTIIKREIIQTLLWSWLVMPILLGGPFILLLPFIQGDDHATSVKVFIASIAWFVVMLWLLADWYEERGTEPKKRLLSKIVK